MTLGEIIFIVITLELGVVIALECITEHIAFKRKKKQAAIQARIDANRKQIIKDVFGG